MSCYRCGRPDGDVETYRMAGAVVRLCAGCLADARLAGIDVAWTPGRLHHAGELAALEAAFKTQARIIEAQRHG